MFINLKLKIAALIFLGAAMASSAWSAPGEDTSFRHAEHPQGAVLFGGSGNSGYLSDTWVWNGKNWTEKFPDCYPPARDSASMAYDKARNEVVLFGGVSDTTLFSDTWVWNGENWKEKHPATVPPARRFAGMAFDYVEKRIVLFGGFDASSFGNGLGDTWVWNGEDWQQKVTSNNPSPRAVLNTMTYDYVLGKVVLFGGLEAAAHFADSDTWQWNGTNWQEQFPASSPDNMFGGFTIAYDGAEERVVAFGQSYIEGSVVPVTWLWDGKNWTRVFPAHNPPNTGIMAYDRFDRKLLLLDNSANTSTWNGTDWHLLSPKTSPPARGGFALSSGPRVECDEDE